MQPLTASDSPTPRLEIYVDVGRDPATGELLMVSEEKIRSESESLGGLSSRFKPFAGRVHLDGRIRIHRAGGRQFLGPNYLIQDVRYMPVFGDTFCKGLTEEVNLNGQSEVLRAASESGDQIRLTIAKGTTTVDAFDIDRAAIASEWFLASTRFARVAMELGDSDAKNASEASFHRLCPEFQKAVGEDRFRATLSDPIVDVFGMQSI